MKISDIKTILQYVKVEARSDEFGIDHYYINEKEVNVNQYRQVVLAIENLEREIK